MEYHQLWETTLTRLQSGISYADFNVFFKNTNILDIQDDADRLLVIIATPNLFAKQTLEKKYATSITEALLDILGKSCQLKFITQKKETPQPPSPTLFSDETSNYLQQQTQANTIKKAILQSRLKEDYTFENFAVSPTNEVAYAGAMAVAKNPGHAYNPLFLYGDVGVGKTHLMQAVGVRILQNNPEANLVYCAGEQFTNEIIDAIRTKKTPEFRNRYRRANVLLIDDIQFIAGKNTVQEEFFHTFNTLQAAGGQIILTSDRPPHEIKLLEDRLRSRFEEGLTIDIQAPNFALRTAILLIKAKQMNQHLPMDVAQAIANHITSTRKLQGFLSQLYAVATLKNQPVSETLVIDLLQKQEGPITSDMIQAPRTYVNPKEIIQAVSKHFNISPNALIGPRRAKPIVTPRQYAMYLLKSDLDISFVEIGRLFGGRDHTTVMHAVEKISKQVSGSQAMQLEFSTIRKQIYG